MRFGGFHPLTLLDFPGQVACILFTQGCNLRCGYCHNPQLIGPAPPGGELVAEEQVLDFLKRRQGLLDGVVVSGGEPTLQADLVGFLRRLRELGFSTKLDTNGTNASMLREALHEGLLDYVAMDLKHDPARYQEITGVAVDPGVLAESRDLLRSSGVAHQFRTTVLAPFHDESTIEAIARFCQGAARFVLQNFHATRVLDPAYQTYERCTQDQLRRFQAIAESYVDKVEIRE